jgi:hypothetical protein
MKDPIINWPLVAVSTLNLLVWIVLLSVVYLMS